MKTIAIIEDDLHIGAILEKTLKKEGYRCPSCLFRDRGGLSFGKRKPGFWFFWI